MRQVRPRMLDPVLVKPDGELIFSRFDFKVVTVRISLIP